MEYYVSVAFVWYDNEIFNLNRFMQQAGNIHSSLMSLPLAPQQRRRIVVPDKYGIERERYVTDTTLDFVRAAIQAGEAKPFSQTGYPFGSFMTQQSSGGLPSATSSATSSLSSVGPPPFQPTAQSPLVFVVK